MAMAPATGTTPEFYPAYCFKASPTHFTWVKMAAADVLRLRRRADYPETYFHLNHPIRFISLAGLITARTEYARVTVLSLDDSSGASIDIVAVKADPYLARADAKPNTNPERDGGADANPAQAQNPGGKQNHISPTTQHTLDITPLVPGTLAHVKGTPSTYSRPTVNPLGTRTRTRTRTGTGEGTSTVQLHLERFTVLASINAEMRFMDQRARVRVEVLSAPWVLSPAEVVRLRGEAEREEERVEAEAERGVRRGRRRVVREEREYSKILGTWEAEERVREREARIAREAGVELMRVLAMGDGVDARKRKWGFDGAGEGEEG
ncbi:OB-fold domain-containing protein [Aspergillus homomorphus CBS 101889]|uniref:CST complex subunit Stn1 N-terminal domain-containing protein n=1 Tax=Aspergillus homomorphus (strain CBS 101889) TaxID=1450537 RepID=A0A395HUY6_ASPHC|nr:hypothetical protein BO97DRAFT_444609 [Aspergillus homomorphus CBS 101889]RAL10648.1 hypothetical protein BO97DRAFT_444609 [Aspergillus homomorphus CBS 101889]